ncbi:oxygen-independent coproporphyrinogen III oxidase [Candidatus Sumerlaeota bacterium]|nr:oxygen-independent coproporphyrinogen III oxidase [Candidatus Sumerlaeota bacterium]
MTASLHALGITAEKIREYDRRIPRYTSYPAAPVWTEAFGAEEWQAHLRATGENVRRLALYVHVPFCGKRCLFCGCNVIVTPKRETAEAYLDTLERELALLRQRYTGDAQVAQLHFGGGTPNYLELEQLARVLGMLRGRFEFEREAEISIEADPRIATPEIIRGYYEDCGFNRISFGVQDFNVKTQEAIGRGQTRDITFRNVQAAREAGFQSVNIDLIYGLPLQTEATWRKTIDEILQLRPDRIALYNFAYLPERMRHQQRLDAAQLPAPETKLSMFIESHDRLIANGWSFIGMDHYALREDALTRAQREGSLRRNFMGYTTLRGMDMLALGVSSISDFQGAYAQNTKKLSVQRKMIEAGLLPVERGLKLSDEDLFRRYVIEEVMCNGLLRFEADAGVPGRHPGDLVVAERERLAPLEQDGLIELHPGRLVVTEKGRIFLRNIAVVFDAYLRPGMDKKPVFSRAV